MLLPPLGLSGETHSLAGEGAQFQRWDRHFGTQAQGGRADTTLAWAGWKQPDIPVEVDTYRLETSRTEAGVLKKLSLAGIAKLSRLKYS